MKNDNNKLNISGLAIFKDNNEKDNFLKQWSSKINSYNVDLDDNN